MTRRYVESLPDSIRIGPYDVPISKVESIREANGECWGVYYHGVISIVFDHPSPGHAAGVFLHECFHAMWSNAAIDDPAPEEKAVSALSLATIGLLRDNNPWLLNWIKRAM